MQVEVAFAWTPNTAKDGRNQFIYFERGLGYRRVFPPCTYPELERRWPDVFGNRHALRERLTR